jgi:O-antigen/teichoic acid export membrane protein
MHFVAATGVAMRMGALIFGVVGILLLESVTWTVAALPLSAFLTLSFVHFSGSRRFGALAFTVALTDTRLVIRRAWPFMSIVLLSVLYGRLGVILLRVMQSDEAVGYFSSAERLLVPFVGITAVFCAAVFPALTRVSPEFRSERDALARRFLRVLLALIFPAATLVFLYRTDIILLLYGQGFVEAVSVLTVLAWVISLRGFNQFLATFSISADLQSRLGALKLLTLAIFLLACFALIPRYSFLGLAYATVIAELSLAIVMLSALKNDNLLRGVAGILWPPAICCIAMIIVTINLTMVALGVRVVLSLATFITAAFLTGAITRHDLGFLLRIAKSGRATDSYSVQLDDD